MRLIKDFHTYCSSPVQLLHFLYIMVTTGPEGCVCVCVCVCVYVCVGWKESIAQYTHHLQHYQQYLLVLHVLHHLVDLLASLV